MLFSVIHGLAKNPQGKRIVERTLGKEVWSNFCDRTETHINGRLLFDLVFLVISQLWNFGI